MRIRFISIIFLLLIICFCVVFNRNVLNINTSLTSNIRSKTDWYASRPCYNIALVVCGHRLWESLVMIKSVLLFNKYDKSNLHFWIFSEDKLITEFVERLNDWRNLVHFEFDILPLTFPKNNKEEWKSLFKPCSSQRLFLPLLLPQVDSVLYVDTDVIFLSPISDIWKYFGRFNASQFAALTSEHEDENMGWYNRFARHPYYGRMGVNSGVMLMNLTRMRIHNWVSHIVPIYNEYKLRITWGDQDIINVFFYYSPDALLLLPCQYNYRPDHCMYISVCNVSVEGIKLMHGNRGYFHSNKQPLFKAVYETVESYKIDSNPYLNFVIPLKASLNVVKETSCGLLTEETILIANKIFGRYQSLKYTRKI
ncbi:glucoside xylosyltransferase 1 isoform X1 [Bactrocera tryoni]|uniref:glucoside xylosyltransferase 1 isoform X1 n=1 Tax=Bactrocera tryoni TaxID=59916 RepID=UPI001A96BA89|nr:glucoside xylosyltransferase 1 isoform X1 [Bactrocera tryoni]